MGESTLSFGDKVQMAALDTLVLAVVVGIVFVVATVLLVKHGRLRRRDQEILTVWSSVGYLVVCALIFVFQLSLWL